jgi:hypothetical protein
MTTKKLMIVAGVVTTLLAGNLPYLAQAQIINVNSEAVNANVNTSSAELLDNKDGLTDAEVDAIIRYVNSSEEAQKKLGIKILKKFYKDLTKEQKELIEKKVNSEKDKKEIKGEAQAEEKPNPEKKPDFLMNEQN